MRSFFYRKSIEWYDIFEKEWSITKTELDTYENQNKYKEISEELLIQNNHFYNHLKSFRDVFDKNDHSNLRNRFSSINFIINRYISKMLAILSERNILMERYLYISKRSRRIVKHKHDKLRQILHELKNEHKFSLRELWYTMKNECVLVCIHEHAKQSTSHAFVSVCTNEYLMFQIIMSYLLPNESLKKLILKSKIDYENLYETMRYIQNYYPLDIFPTIGRFMLQWNDFGDIIQYIDSNPHQLALKWHQYNLNKNNNKKNGQIEPKFVIDISKPMLLVNRKFVLINKYTKLRALVRGQDEVYDPELDSTSWDIDDDWYQNEFHRTRTYQVECQFVGYYYPGYYDEYCPDYNYVTVKSTTCTRCWYMPIANLEIIKEYPFV